MLKQAKQAILRTARTLSIHDGWSNSQWRRRRLLILCYHGISLGDEHEWDSELYMDRTQFRARMEMLRQGGYTVLPLGEACQRLDQGTLPPRAVALTFDDGDYDFSAIAWPVLQEYGYPATVYVTTFYVDHQKPIFRLFCSYLLWLARGAETGGERRLPVTKDWALPLPQGLGTAAPRAAALAAIEAHVQDRQLPLSGREELAVALAAALGLDYDELLRSRVLQLMRPEEIANVAAAGADVQLHTHRHRTPRQRDLFLREIDDNRRRIEEITGRAPVHFCYPSGVTDAAFPPWLRERGVVTATTCVPGLAAPGADPLLLPRVVDHCSLSEVEIESWMAGLSQYLIRRPG
jgi:peptidoglycan/xylan/chitin deacetylase (PgdA/CDA1 family)